MKTTVPGNIVFHLTQDLSSTEEDAHVAVMTAGVHLACKIGRKGPGPVSSVMGRASISARKAMTGPGLPP